MAITTAYDFNTDLNKGGLREVLRSPLYTFNSKAHVFTVSVKQGDAALSMSGAKCKGYFIRADGVTVPIDGSVSGSTVSVTLLPNCYAVQGRFELSIDLILGDVIHTILHVDGSILRTRTDSLTTGGSAVQSFDELVAAVQGADAAMQRRNRVVNLLDNSDFRAACVIAQAGLNGMHGSVKYVCDRWISGDADAAFTDEYMTPGSATDQRFHMTDAEADAMYTIALYLADGTKKVYTGKPANGFGTYATIYCGVSDAASKRYFVRIGANQNVKHAALLPGSYTADTLPEYQPKGYAAELAECQRYYENSWHPGNTYQQNQMQGFVASSAVDAYVSFKTAKRILPTVSLYPYNPDLYTSWTYFNGASKDAAAMSTVMRCGNNGFMARLVPAAGDTPTRGFSYAVDGHWEASADL